MAMNFGSFHQKFSLRMASSMHPIWLFWRLLGSQFSTCLDPKILPNLRRTHHILRKPTSLKSMDMVISNHFPYTVQNWFIIQLIANHLYMDGHEVPGWLVKVSSFFSISDVSTQTLRLSIRPSGYPVATIFAPPAYRWCFVASVENFFQTFSVRGTAFLIFFVGKDTQLIFSSKGYGIAFCTENKNRPYRQDGLLADSCKWSYGAPINGLIK